MGKVPDLYLLSLVSICPKGFPDNWRLQTTPNFTKLHQLHMLLQNQEALDLLRTDRNKGLLTGISYQLEALLWTSIPDCSMTNAGCISLAPGHPAESGQWTRCTLTPPDLWWAFQPSWALTTTSQFQLRSIYKREYVTPYPLKKAGILSSKETGAPLPGVPALLSGKKKNCYL